MRHLVLNKSVLIHIENEFLHIRDARQTMLFALNHVLRFCPNVALCIPPTEQDLLASCNDIIAMLYGRAHTVRLVEFGCADLFDAVINIGKDVLAHPGACTVNSSGWLARIACSGAGMRELHSRFVSDNAIGALAAACLGAGAAFRTVVGLQPNEVREISLFSNEDATPGTLDPGPALPVRPVFMDCLLVGCGAVMNGWAYAVKLLPITGVGQAVDRQALQTQNLGAYVICGRESVGAPKADILKTFLSPNIAITSRPEEWELYQIRLHYGAPVPPLVICGLDNVPTRHSVQRLWPKMLIDMAAEGMNSQVIAKQRGTKGLCLLQAFTASEDGLAWARRLSEQTGLRLDRILNDPTGLITQADVDAAPVEKRHELERDHQQGQRVCGRITRQNLELEGEDPDFAPAVPFVTSFSGVVAAGWTMRWLIESNSHDLHYQKSFLSGNSRATWINCRDECECQERPVANFGNISRNEEIGITDRTLGPREDPYFTNSISFEFSARRSHSQ